MKGKSDKGTLEKNFGDLDMLIILIVVKTSLVYTCAKSCQNVRFKVVGGMPVINKTIKNKPDQVFVLFLSLCNHINNSLQTSRCNE